ncbi:glutamate receptor ionotropic, kainate 2-like isoform X3 [Ostrea edulis]|uniref:glutamate receptor ionotropic, kainate 2-like isoform X3 n=1 Tax=Ostrea edulis TaxID=37623 RepID=UPI0024AFE241|nr:glutamate receptor ionotropic, kainate 2-like isoform X3 [Ostrea edulis]
MWKVIVFLVVSGMGLRIKADDSVKVAVLPEWWQYVRGVISRSQMSSTQLINLTIGTYNSQYEAIEGVQTYLNESETDVIIGPCIRSISVAAEELRIPYLCVTSETEMELCTFKLLPVLSDFIEAMTKLVYSQFRRQGKAEPKTIIYEGKKGFHFDVELLNNPLTTRVWVMNDEDTDDKRRTITHYLMLMRKELIREIIVICDTETVKILLETAWELAMLSLPFRWYFYDPAFQLRPILENLPRFENSFTVFTLIPYHDQTTFASRDIDLNTILMLDAISVVSNISHNFTSDEKRQKSFRGLTGSIRFDANHQRMNYNINMVHFDGSKYFKLGSWESGDSPYQRGVKLENSPDVERWRNRNQTYTFPLKGRTIKVVTIIEEPFVMYKKGYENMTGNDRFEGYCVELLHELSKILDFKYELYLVHDNKFGARLSDGSWNGMIGEVLAGNATMLVASLSVNAGREEAMDFTKPFMTRYVTLIMKIPATKTRVFEFLSPLSHTIYLCTLSACIVVACSLYFFERNSVFEKREKVTFKECVWYIFGTLLEGGTEGTPTTTSGRILIYTWCFFVLILVASYTANWAAFLTVEQFKAPVKSVYDLTSQKEIQYGTVRSSAILSFFKTSNVETFRKIGNEMINNASNIVATSAEGYQRVSAGGYGFFWDSTVNSYKINRECQLTTIGPDFAPRGYGVGVPPGATYLEELSINILRLGDKGFLDELQQKWWGERKCLSDEEEDEKNTSGLKLENAAGLFFVLGAGILLSVFVLFIQNCIRNIRPDIRTGKNETVT